MRARVDARERASETERLNARDRSSERWEEKKVLSGSFGNDKVCGDSE